MPKRCAPGLANRWVMEKEGPCGISGFWLEVGAGV